MRQDKPDEDSEERREIQPFQVRLPGFIVDHEVGLGDAIKGVTFALGVKACGGCEKRASELNRWIVFSK